MFIKKMRSNRDNQIPKRKGYQATKIRVYEGFPSSSGGYFIQAGTSVRNRMCMETE
jgi:hypothetical protein